MAGHSTCNSRSWLVLSYLAKRQLVMENEEVAEIPLSPDRFVLVSESHIW